MKTPEHLRAYRKEYYKKNKAKELAYWKKWAAAHPERRKAIVKKSLLKSRQAQALPASDQSA